MKRKLIIGMLKTIAALPLRFLYLLSDFFYPVVYYVVGYRRKIVRKNLREAFPEKSEKELLKIEKAYYHYLCDIIVETVKLLNVSPEEMARRVSVEDSEEARASVEEGRNVVLLLGHYGNWEWVQELNRIFPSNLFKASIYHPLKSKLWDDIYKEIRGRWGVNIIPQNEAVRALLKKENRPWICGFIADHRPHHDDRANITPFLNHATSFIYGPEVLGSKFGADFYFLEMERPRRGYYTIRFHRLHGRQDTDETYPHTREFWRRFESVIKKNPAYWLWSHKRWKFDRLLSEADAFPAV